MQKKDNQRAGAPLVEIILTVGIFALCSVVIIRLFLGAHYAAVYSKDLNIAIVQAQSIIEQLKSDEPMEEVFAKSGFAEDGKNSYSKEYDRNWAADSENAVYRAVVKVTQSDDGMCRIAVKYERLKAYPFLKEARKEILNMNAAQYRREAA